MTFQILFIWRTFLLTRCLFARAMNIVSPFFKLALLSSNYFDQATSIFNFERVSEERTFWLIVSILSKLVTISFVRFKQNSRLFVSNILKNKLLKYPLKPWEKPKKTWKSIVYPYRFLFYYKSIQIIPSHWGAPLCLIIIF